MKSPSSRPNRSSTKTREVQLSNLTRRIAVARHDANHGATERDILIRRYGLGHPKSIDASHRLDHARDADRRLSMLRDRIQTELGRMQAHDRVRTTSPRSPTG